MKKMKRLVALALSVVMVLAMSVMAFADDNQAETNNKVNVSVPEDMSGHTFVAYQIFKGNQIGESKVLTDVEWGADINDTALLEALKNVTTGKGKDQKTPFKNCKSAADVAKVLGTVQNDSDVAKKVAKLALENKKTASDNTTVGKTLTSGENTLTSGYYLIVDTTSMTDNGNKKDDALNAALLQVTKDITIAKKTDKPSVEKKVKENTKYKATSDYGDGYNDVADYNMGDAVPFHLIGKVPDMSRYDTYKYIFHDTLSTGLTAPDAKNVKVYLSSDKTTGKDKATEITEEFTEEFTVKVTGQNITVTFDDLKNVITDTDNQKYVIVEYNATLNQNANVGLPGNENKVKLEYSNNPDQSGSGENTPTGETPEDKVIVFTYRLNVTKVDGENTNTKLKDAEFKLYKVTGNNTEWAQVDTDGKVTKWVNSEDDATTLKSDKDGLFHVIGLDDGTYYLKETKAPAGYNLLTSAIKLEISATTTITPSNTNNKQTNQSWAGTPSDALTGLTISVNDGTAVEGKLANREDKTDEAGSVDVTVENNKGSQLPTTGGIGTTIFYIIGGILMVGAAILLITKRRAEN